MSFASRTRRVWSGLLAVATAFLACTAWDDAALPMAPLDASPDAANDAHSDASSDASSDAIANPASFCSQTPHTICDDFDQGRLGAAWDGVTVERNRTVALDSTLAVSSPNSLLGRLLGGLVIKPSLSRRWRTGTPPLIRCEMKVRPDPLDTHPPSIVGLYVFWPGGNSWVSLSYSKGDNGTTLVVTPTYDVDGGRYSETKSFDGLVESTWRRIGIEVEATDSALIARAFVEGDKVAEIGVPGSRPLTDVTFWLGPAQLDETGTAWAIRYDDVYCDL